MEKNFVYDLIILGAGPVGLFSAGLCGYYGMKALVIESSHDHGGMPAKLYANKPVHDFPTYKSIDGQDLVDKLYDCADQYQENVHFQYNTLIEKHYFDEDRIIHLVDTNNNEYCAKRVLLTIGKGSYDFVKPELENIENNDKIKYSLNHLQDISNVKNAIVLGGGDGAVDIAIHLAKQNINVCLVHRKDEVRAKGDAIERLKQNNVTTYLNYALEKIEDELLHIFHNETRQKTSIKYDLIIVQYGVCPLTMPIHSWDKFEKVNKKYVVDRHFKTSVPGFYAVGSCVTYENRFDLMITGIGEASIAINDIYASLYPNKKGW